MQIPFLQARFCLYKLVEEESWEDDSGFRISRGIPPNSSVEVLVRVYIVSVSRALLLILF